MTTKDEGINRFELLRKSIEKYEKTKYNEVSDGH